MFDNIKNFNAMHEDELLWCFIKIHLIAIITFIVTIPIIVFAMPPIIVSAFAPPIIFWLCLFIGILLNIKHVGDKIAFRIIASLMLFPLTFFMIYIIPLSFLQVFILSLINSML